MQLEPTRAIQTMISESLDISRTDGAPIDIVDILRY